MANPAELAYQTGRSVYYFRMALNSNKVYNAVTKAYETYNVSNWAQYANTVSELFAGIYRAAVPTESLSIPATEYWFEIRNLNPSNPNNADATDAPSIAVGNSQGVNIGTINGVQTSLGLNVQADIDICNLALTHLGQKKITTLDDASENARRCKQIYATCRDEVFRVAAWKFATVIKQLTDISNTTTVPVGWTYVYAYPTDAVLVRKVFVDNVAVFDFPFFANGANSFVFPVTNPEPQEARVMYFSGLDALGILSNLSPFYVEYTARVTNSSLYDPSFVKTLSYKLAGDLAGMLTGKPQQTTEMSQKYFMSLSEAARQNAIEDNVPMRNKSQYMDCR